MYDLKVEVTCILICLLIDLINYDINNPSLFQDRCFQDISRFMKIAIIIH